MRVREEMKAVGKPIVEEGVKARLMIGETSALAALRTDGKASG